MQRLAESWDVVEVVRSLVTEVDSLQKIVAGQEARLQVLERPAAPRPLTPAYSAEPSTAAPPGASAGVSPGGNTAAGAYLSQVFTDWLDLTHARSNHSATYGPRSIAPVTPP